MFSLIRVILFFFVGDDYATKIISIIYIFGPVWMGLQGFISFARFNSLSGIVFL